MAYPCDNCKRTDHTTSYCGELEVIGSPTAQRIVGEVYQKVEAECCSFECFVDFLRKGLDKDSSNVIKVT